MACAYVDSLASLRHDFLKRKMCRNKLPKMATSVLQDWWRCHVAWPYPNVSATIPPGTGGPVKTNEAILYPLSLVPHPIR
eukprot:1181859-Prorocentrum_minimum.AAC.1